MSLEKTKEYINKMPNTIKHVYLHFSGESFLNPDIHKIISFLSEKNIITSVSTNGTLPSKTYIKSIENGLNNLIFAIDGATAKTHEKHRIGSNWNKIIKTLSEVTKSRTKNSKVGVQYLVTRQNENEIEKMKEILKKIKVDFLNLKTISLDIASNKKLEKNILKNAKEYLPMNNKYSRYHYNKDKLILKYPIIICPFIYEPTIGADGEVSICCIDIDKQIKIGNLNDYSSFNELWNTKSYKKIRKLILKKSLSICKTCNYSQIGLKSMNLN